MDFLMLSAGLGTVHPARQSLRCCHYTKVSLTADTAAATDDHRQGPQIAA